MNEFQLKYGCNPNQKPAHLDLLSGGDLPFEILNGRPGYINFMDALNSWQLVKELKAATGMPCATSFKHVSPTSAAVGKVLPIELKKACFVEDVAGLDENPLACAYVRARGTDRMCSFGDWVALSDVCDELTASLIAPEVSDGVIAPGYTEKALEILKGKRKGSYNVVKIDPNYVPKEEEIKEVFGIAFHQGRNNFKIDEALLSNIVTKNKELPENATIFISFPADPAPVLFYAVNNGISRQFHSDIPFNSVKKLDNGSAVILRYDENPAAYEERFGGRLEKTAATKLHTVFRLHK